MENVKSMGYESILEPGAAVVFGTKANSVSLPGESGAGIPAGVYSAEADKILDKPDTEDSAPITRMGPAKVLAGGTVTAGAFGYVGAATGRMEVLPATAGAYLVYGQFEEAGAAGEYVEFNVSIQQVTVSV